MGDEQYPLIRRRSGSDLIFGREPLGDVRGQVPRFPEFLDVPLRDGGGHPLALLARSGHGWSALWGRKGLKLGRWSSRADGLRRKMAWGKKMGPYPLIKTVSIKRPLTGLKTRLFPRGRANGTVGIPKPVLIRIPQ